MFCHKEAQDVIARCVLESKCKQPHKKSHVWINLISFLKDQQRSGDKPSTEPVGWSRCPVRGLYHGTGHMWARGRCCKCLGKDSLLWRWRWYPVVSEVSELKNNWIHVLLWRRLRKVRVFYIHWRFFLNEAELSLNSVISVNLGNLINCWSMNWADFKDLVSQRWQVRILLMTNIFVIEFAEFSGAS